MDIILIGVSVVENKKSTTMSPSSKRQRYSARKNPSVPKKLRPRDYVMRVKNRQHHGRHARKKYIAAGIDVLHAVLYYHQWF